MQQGRRKSQISAIIDTRELEAVMRTRAETSVSSMNAPASPSIEVKPSLQAPAVPAVAAAAAATAPTAATLAPAGPIDATRRVLPASRRSLPKSDSKASSVHSDQSGDHIADETTVSVPER